MSKLEAGFVLLNTRTNELLMLLKRSSKEYHDDTAEVVWDIMEMTSGLMTWEWEFILEDERDFQIL